MMNFTNDEMNLMCIYQSDSRSGLIAALTEMRGYLDEDEAELRDLTDSTLQKLGEMTEAAPELVLPDWAQRTNLTLKDSAGSVVVQGDAAAFAMYAYPKNGSYELTLTAYRNTADPGDATGWYRYCASYTMNIQPKAVLSSERVSQGGVTKEDSAPVIRNRDSSASTTNNVTIRADTGATANVTLEDTNIDPPGGAGW